MKIDRYFNKGSYWVDEQNKSINIDYLKNRYKNTLKFGQYVDGKFEYRTDIISIISLKQERKLKYNKILND